MERVLSERNTFHAEMGDGGGEKLPIVDRCTLLAVEIKKEYCRKDLRMHKEAEEDQAREGKLVPNTFTPASCYTHQINHFRERNRTTASVCRRSFEGGEYENRKGVGSGADERGEDSSWMLQALKQCSSKGRVGRSVAANG